MIGLQNRYLCNSCVGILLCVTITFADSYMEAGFVLFGGCGLQL